MINIPGKQNEYVLFAKGMSESIEKFFSIAPSTVKEAYRQAYRYYRLSGVFQMRAAKAAYEANNTIADEIKINAKHSYEQRRSQYREWSTHERRLEFNYLRNTRRKS